MPLESTLVDQMMSGGLNDSIDPRVAPPGTFLALENVTYDQSGALVPRFGFVWLGANDSRGGNMDKVEVLAASGGETLAVHVDEHTPSLYTLLDSHGVWRECDPVSHFAIRRAPMVRWNHQTALGSVAASSAATGFVVQAWADLPTLTFGSGVDIITRTVDQATGAVVAPETKLETLGLVGTGADTFKLIAVDGVPMLVGLAKVGSNYNLIGFWWNQAALAWNPSHIISTGFTAASGFPAYAKYFDLYDVGDGRVAVAWQIDCTASANATAAEHHMFVRVFDTTWSTVTAPRDLGHVIDGTGSANPGPRGIAICGDTTVMYVAWGADDASIVYEQLNPTTLATVAGPIVLQGTTAGSVPSRLSCCLDGFDQMILSWRQNFTNPAFVWLTVPPTGTGLPSSLSTIWGGTPVSAPFFDHGHVWQIVGNANGIVVGADPATGLGGTELQSLSVYALDETGNSNFYYAGDLAPDGDDVNVVNLVAASRPAPPALLESGGLAFAAGILPGSHDRGIDVWELNGNPLDLSRYNTCEANGLLYISGGITNVYDGQGVYEAAFASAPSIKSHTSPGGANTYSWVFTWEWWDAKGNLHRSLVSNPTKVTAPATPGVTFVFHDLAPTQRGRDENGIRRKVRLGAYRTTNGGTTWFRVNNPQAIDDSDSLPGDFSLATLSWTDTVTDAILSSNAYGILYADPTTGVLDNEPVPASLDVHTHRNRVWLVSAEDDHEIWYSKEVLRGEGPGWNSVLTIRIDEANDGLRALGSLDAALVAFTPSKIYCIDGQGPNDTGAQNDYAVSRVTSNVGCDNPRSVIAFEGGLIFQAPNGHIYMLDRSRSVQYIGQAIESTSEQFTRAISVSIDDERTRIVWVLAKPSGSVVNSTTKMVWYDYRLNAWGTYALAGGVHDHFDGAHCLDSQGRLVAALASAGDIARESTGYQDGPSAGGFAFARAIGLPWLRVGAIAGFQRVRRSMVTGASSGAGSVTLLYAYDYAPEAERSYTKTYAGVQEPLQIDAHLEHQKCAAVQLTIVATPTDDQRGPDFIGATWEVGVLRGREKWKQANRAVAGGDP